MKKRFMYVWWLTIVLIVFSCSIDDDRTNFEYTALETLSASLPDTFDLGEVYSVDVRLLRPDECTFSETFDVKREFTDSTNIRTITPIGIKLNQSECAIANDSIQDVFQFEVIYTEPYIFRFYAGDDGDGAADFFEIEVPVR